MKNWETNPYWCFPKAWGDFQRIGAPWTPNEDKHLLYMFEIKKAPMEEICRKHGRKEGGILSRLSHLLGPNFSRVVVTPRIDEHELKQLRQDLFSLSQRVEIFVSKYEGH